MATDPAGNTIMAHDKHDVAGQTTVYIWPTKLAFARGVEDCLKQAGGKARGSEWGQRGKGGYPVTARTVAGFFSSAHETMFLLTKGPWEMRR